MFKREPNGLRLPRCMPAVLVLASATLPLASNCAHLGDDCEYTRSCPPEASGGSAGSSGGNTTTGGLSSAGIAGNADAGRGGGDEQGGAAAGGQGGAGGAPACDGACGGATPVCDEATNQCVECSSKGDCSAPTAACDLITNTCVACAANTDCKAAAPVCDLTTNTCVACLDNTDCRGVRPLCDLDTNTCVECLEQTDCSDAIASRCDSTSHTCEPCSTDAHCADIDGKGVCFEGECVECTAEKPGPCGADQGTPLVCDSLKRTCTLEKAGSADLCQPCVSDAQCMPGELCVLDTIGTGAAAKAVGYFCHWKKGDVANGAPALCSSGRPYVRTLTGATSVDGETADICTLRTSTCIANDEFSSKDCAPTSTPDDSLCGVAPPADALCALFDTDTYRCTMTCLSDDDCRTGSSCNIARGVCAL